MFTSKLRQLASREERSKMYSEVAQSEATGEEKASSGEFTELYGDYRELEQRLRNLKVWVYSLGTILALTVALLVLTNTSVVGHKNPWKPTPVPEMPMTTVTFRKEEVYANNTAPGSDEAWSELMPKGDGFVVINNPEQYQLQPGKPSSEGPLYDITMFHQLHCLRHIRVYLYTIIEIANNAGNNSDAINMFLGRQDPHVHHCFDYIRQGIMCSADLTVEWPKEEPDGGRFSVDGWGIQHQCKSWEGIRAWMEENRFHHPWEKDQKLP
ncbi:Meiosis protein mei2 [Sphaceloma murrayae]|uniref:Meiosis protein mei2 n=1 Tax=Sphaceloma murrayae TaxID=2082308 RepID=A0A2K1QQS9_9PEZI|nr:Meiosis protein mei2 [Sphaceloma murrayae]